MMPENRSETRASSAVVIGASAGALEALSIILPPLPKNYARAILIVVHIPPDRESVLPDIFGSKCNLAVQEAADKEPILAGTIYFAPPDYHLLVERDKRLSLSNEEAVHFSRPSIDVLFSSAADTFQSSLTGILLTGANRDGADGLHEIEQAGGTVLVQNPDSAAASEMPAAGLAQCRNAQAMSLQEIAACLCNVGQT